MQWIGYEDHPPIVAVGNDKATKDWAAARWASMAQELRATCGDERERLMRVDDEYHRYLGKTAACLRESLPRPLTPTAGTIVSRSRAGRRCARRCSV